MPVMRMDVCDGNIVFKCQLSEKFETPFKKRTFILFLLEILDEFLRQQFSKQNNHDNKIFTNHQDVIKP